MRKCLKCNTIVDYSEWNEDRQICKKCIKKLEDRRLDLIRWYFRKDPMTTEDLTELIDLLVWQINDLRSSEKKDQIADLKDKLHRRNMQIEDLKKKQLTPEEIDMILWGLQKERQNLSDLENKEGFDNSKLQKGHQVIASILTKINR